MAIAAPDGAWLTATKIMQFDCTKCGNFLTKRATDREQDEIIRQHILAKHNRKAK